MCVRTVHATCTDCKWPDHMHRRSPLHSLFILFYIYKMLEMLLTSDVSSCWLCHTLRGIVIRADMEMIMSIKDNKWVSV